MVHALCAEVWCAVCVGVLALVGELEMWDKAEAALQEALDASGREWVMNPGDGAFYGPKIDITGEQRVNCLLSNSQDFQRSNVTSLTCVKVSPRFECWDFTSLHF